MVDGQARRPACAGEEAGHANQPSPSCGRGDALAATQSAQDRAVADGGGLAGVRLRLHPVDHLPVLHPVEDHPQLQPGRLSAVRAGLVASALGRGGPQPVHLRHAVHRPVPRDRPAARHPARPAHSPGRHAARDLSLPDGAVLHRHRHGLEMDAQPGAGGGEAGARSGAGPTSSSTGSSTSTWRSIRW